MGIRRDKVPIYKGCLQGATESPSLWITQLEDVMAPTLSLWQRKASGVYLRNLVVDRSGTLLGSKGDTVVWVSRPAFAGDLLLVSTSVNGAV